MKKVLFVGVLVTGTSLLGSEVAASTESIDGFYVGLGLQYSHVDHKINATDGTSNDGDPIDVYMEVSHKKIDKLGGTFVLGYGKLLSDFYIGGEVLCDLAENKNVNDTYGEENSPYYSQVRETIPSLAVRAGYHFSAINCLAYAKLGFAFLHAEFQEQDPTAENNIRKMNKVAPLIGLGIEKNICNHFNLRGEVEYRFKVKNTSQTIVPTNGVYNVENHLKKGITVRLMATYNF